MLARCCAASTVSGRDGAQIVRRPRGQALSRSAGVMAMGKTFASLVSFFLCISAQWLFWELPQSWSAGRQSKRFTSMSQHDVMSTERTATAVRIFEPTDADGFPSRLSWGLSRPLRFNADWQGKNADPERETEGQLLWTPETLFVRFRATFPTITTFPDADPYRRRDHLWDHDVAEVFLQPDTSPLLRYNKLEG